MKIYILTPSNSTSGGPETLHQLANVLNNNGIECFTKYYGKNRNIPKHLSNYNIKEVKKIKDDYGNMIICPETATQYLKLYPKSKKIVWWLSVDFYKLFTELKNITYKNFLKKLFYNKLSIDFNKNQDYFHLYNCEYAREFLLKNKVSEKRMFELCGPINSQYIDNKSYIKKEPIIAFNPKKGKDFTDKIIEFSKEKNFDFKFIPIENMDSNQVDDLLSRASVYIDFGNFPGPERLPREAVLKECIILTGREGASRNEIDVPIPTSYKFEKNDNNISNIVNQIDISIKEYDNRKIYFENYRKKVLKQINDFEDNSVCIIHSISKE